MAPVLTKDFHVISGVTDLVITNIGAVGTHAVIVSRELGIPCVISATDATRRIPHGARVRVDGSSGLVTILEDVPSTT